LELPVGKIMGGLKTRPYAFDGKHPKRQLPHSRTNPVRKQLPQKMIGI